ncbi:hypothetical protein E5161_06635 [Cohnella pontilimi]|uniref:DUF948 domain-containing protein n=1 Tax=Cohnella pontilimi TaxID=2564100 RepID=A0A4U0FF93_9BACL|nr:hypothetical protein [Cohnella pontilimi]TJY43545.1 hypothetical protein E5161_06635 [Cohnella pontilimi]
MAWNVAAYVFAAAALIASVAFAAVMMRLSRSLSRWDRLAEGVVRKAEKALDESISFAREGRAAAELCRTTVGGFARLSDGARAVGDAAESAAEAAVYIASFWRDLATLGSAPPDEELNGAESYWTAIARTLAENLRKSIFGREDGSYRP